VRIDRGAGAMAAAGLAAALVTLALLLLNNHGNALPFPWLSFTLGLVFTVAAVVAQARRPENRTGFLLFVVALEFFAFDLSQANSPYVFTFGQMCGSLVFAGFAHLMLAYPAGRLDRDGRRVIAAGYALAGIAAPLSLLFSPDPARCGECPRNVLLLSDQPGVEFAFLLLTNGLAIVVVARVAVLLHRRWRGASVAYRRALRVPYVATGLFVTMLALAFALNPVNRSVTLVLVVGAVTAAGAVPFFLLVGLVRGRFAGATIGDRKSVV